MFGQSWHDSDFVKILQRPGIDSVGAVHTYAVRTSMKTGKGSEPDASEWREGTEPFGDVG